MLLVVKVGKDPERVWAAGDDVITYEQFLVEHDICARKTYERFVEGLEKLQRTSMVAGTSADGLVQQVGHEAISRLPRIKTIKNTERFLGAAIDLRKELGFVPSAKRLDALVREVQPRVTPPERPPENDVKKLRAKLEFAEAEVTRLQAQQQHLEAENKRLMREIELLRRQTGNRRPRKAAA